MSKLDLARHMITGAISEAQERAQKDPSKHAGDNVFTVTESLLASIAASLFVIAQEYTQKGKTDATENL